MDRFSKIQLASDGATFSGLQHPERCSPFKFSANFPLFLIGEAQARGCSFEDLADGFGQGLGTCGGDWWGIRDSSETATEQMFQRALNFLFPERS